MKHSSGSWIVDGNGFTNDYDVSNHERSIATVKTRADAELMASAPEMLNALETILFAVTVDAENNQGRVDRSAIEGLAIEALRKAKGK